MINNFISSKVVIGETYAKYGIKSSGWEADAPMFIFHALGQIGINYFTFNSSRDIAFDGYKFQLPMEFRLINKIRFRTTVEDQGMYINAYYTINGTWVNVDNLEKGIAMVDFKALPAEYDSETELTFPIIPDDEPLKEAIRIYLLMSILIRGYIHPFFSLSANNIWINPQMMFERQSRKARVSVSRIDPIEMNKLSKRINTFISPVMNVSNYLKDIHR